MHACGFGLAIPTKLDGSYCDKSHYLGLLVANNDKLTRQAEKGFSQG